MTAAPLRVALVALNAPGYRSLALGYLRAFGQADERLRGKVAFETQDLTTEVDPWWVAYRVLAMEPDVLAVSVTCWSARPVFETCRLVKTARPETTVVLGGPEVGPIAAEVLGARTYVDAVVRGEGEETFAELLGALARGEEPRHVDGVTFRDAHGAVREAPDRALVDELDRIPSPYLARVMAPADGATFLETYRGCPHRCSYCFEGKGYGRLRMFSRERVLAEIQAVTSDPGVGTFSFIDPVFNLSEERLRWLSDALAPAAARGVRLHTVEVDIERMDSAGARLLARAGVASVETGPQTVGAEGLGACGRTFDPQRFSAGVAALKAEGISVECDLIIGLPGDDAFTFAAGLRTLLDLDPGAIQSSTLHVLPGTDLWADAERSGTVFDAEPPHEVVSTPRMSFNDLRRAEVLGAFVQRAYRARRHAAPNVENAE